MPDQNLPSSFGRRLSRWLEAFGHGPSAPHLAAPAPSRPGETSQAIRPGAPEARPRAALVSADRVERLRRLAHEDRATGLSNRRHLVGRLAAALAEPSANGAGLLILRVLGLPALRERLGNDASTQLLCTVADVISAYPPRVDGAFAGRLNESDFALFLPVRGMAEETAMTLSRTLRASPVGSAALADLAIGGVDGLGGESIGQALAAADLALAQAEAAGPFCVQIHHAAESEPVLLGERAWRVRLDEALAEGRVTIGEFPVADAEGRLLHLDCPVRAQLELGGPFRDARAWLPMALRHRLMPRMDLLALDLALVAAVRDARPRCVHVSAASLATPGFVGEVQRRLESSPGAHGLIWLELADSPWLERAAPRLREAGAAWRRHGAKLGIEHVGASVAALARLGRGGIDHVKVDARFVRGLAADAAVRDYAAGLVELARCTGLLMIAEGVERDDDLAALRALGFDGATGPAVR